MPENKTLTGYPSIDKPWMKYYSEEAINAPLPECTIYEYLWENNKNFPSEIAINYYGKLITYKELFDQIDKTASAFLSLDVQPGEYVSVALPSIPEALYVVYALNKIGAVANMIHPLAGEAETILLLNEVESRIAVLFDKGYELAANGIKKTHVEHTIVISAGCSLPPIKKKLFSLKSKKAYLPNSDHFMYWEDFIKRGQGAPFLQCKKDIYSAAIMSHTGGTTGEPKGVICSDFSINAMIWQIAHTFPIIRQENQMAVLPPFVNYSLVNAMLEPIALGSTAILIPDYKPEKFAEYARKYKPIYISSIPPYWEMLLKSKKIKKCDLSSLKYPIYGGEAMNPELESAVNQVLLSCGAPNKLMKGLGATEVVSAATLTFLVDEKENEKDGGVGIPLCKTTCAIIDPDNGEELTYDKEGEICFSGPTVMIGYYNKPEETASIIKVHSDGQRWLHTGDLGYIDQDGAIFVTGRIKRIMITRGKDGISAKMFPDRIENAVCTHPSVEQSCAIGFPDAVRNLIPVVFVILKNGSAPSDQLTNEIIATCKEMLPEYMVPEKVEYCADFPRTTRGKIDYRALEEMAKEF